MPAPEFSILGWLLAAAAGVVSLLAALGAAAALRRVARVRIALKDVRPPEMRRLSPHARLDHLTKVVPRASWMGELVARLGEETSEEGRVRLVDDALVDIERELDVPAGWPTAAARVSALGGLAFGIAAFLAGSPAAAAVAAVLGLSGTATALLARRRAAESAGSCRREVDAMVDALAGMPASSPVEPPSGRGGRGRRSRRLRSGTA